LYQRSSWENPEEELELPAKCKDQIGKIWADIEDIDKFDWEGVLKEKE
jgi:hypothetical protein